MAYLALGLMLLVSVAGTWHSEQPDRDCPVCHIAHLPVLAPAPAPALAPPRLLEHRALPSDARQGSQVANAIYAPRAPPTSA